LVSPCKIGAVTGTGEAPQWSAFVAEIEGIAGRPLSEDAEGWCPFGHDALDSLAISELGMYLLNEFGLDLFDPRGFAAARELTLGELYERANATRAAGVRS
jgi:hypothetical protein